MLTENSIKVLKRRYLLKDDNGEIIETPSQLFRRVANSIALANFRYESKETCDKLADEFYYYMSNCIWMPNTPCLMNAGKENGQLSACFVLPVGDSMEEIFDSIKNAAIIHKTGGGTGFSFSRLRPNGSRVKTTNGVASGPVSFMKVFNAATEAVKQGGTRRGANMGILRVDHPDILEFIDCKKDLTQVTNFNISVAITDEFMHALRDKRDYALINPKTKKQWQYKNGDFVTLSAEEVFDKIVENAWKSGEPGIVFIDKINEMNPGRHSEEIEATNPCGEIPLPPYDVCNLLSINLDKCVKGNYKEGYHLDWDFLREAATSATLFLDSIIDANCYPILEIEEQVLKSRRIGLGVMGFADMLAKLAIPYNSQESLHLADLIMSTIKEVADDVSFQLGKTRGTAYGLTGRRNTTTTMIAPTGTISIIAGCSSGIEPFYSIAFVRNVMEGTRLVEVNAEFEKIAKERGFYSEELMEKIANCNSIQHMEEIPEDVRRIFVTAADVSPEMHVKMQAVFQKYCDSAVSKTINLPENATKQDVKNAYLLAYELDCKGVTVYRDGSRPGQVLSTGATPESSRNTEQIGAFGTISSNDLSKIGAQNTVLSNHFPADQIPQVVFSPFSQVSTTMARPTRVNGYTEKIKTGYGNLYVTINSLNNKPFEVFASIGKSGFSMMADTEGICRMISLSLRNNVPVEEIIDQLQGIGGSLPVMGINGTVYSIPDAIAKVLKGIVKDPVQMNLFDISKEKCPDCSSDLNHSEGCIKCQSCGFSRC